MRNKIQLIVQKSKKGSLTRGMAVIILGLVAGTVMLCWLLNTVFLERYYVMNKQNMLLSGFGTIDGAAEAGVLGDKAFDVTFDNFCANGNVTVMVMDSDWTIVRSSVNDPQRMLTEFWDIIFGEREKEVTVLKQADRYVIQRQTDKRLDSEYLVLYGTLSNGNMVLMRSALESIRESVKISNQFLGYIGMMALVVSAVITVFVSRRITHPIVELTDLSKRMTELDFEAKYRARGAKNNEIDELGEHMNEMSLTLERTISELKSANNQLLIDIEKKTQIDEMRREFLSNVSHELKTPLALISGYAEGLKECINEDAESRDFYCEVIMDEAAKMNRMVKKLLTLNQLESGSETVTMERFNLTELIQGVLHSVEILLQQKQIVVAECPDDPVYVWADEFMVEEVLTNYLSNAIHHARGVVAPTAPNAGQAGGQIAVRYERRDSLIRVCVFNTGQQIPEADIDKIWQKFYKVDKARTREYGGSGIGLSIVRAIMESFHRDCGVQNCENGVEFWFELDTGSDIAV